MLTGDRKNVADSVAGELGVDEVIDLATLTGACMVALGTQAAGIMGNDEDLIHRLIETAGRNGERFWQLPIWEEYADSLNIDVADNALQSVHTLGKVLMEVQLLNI